MGGAARQYVFGYGSLLERGGEAEGSPCELTGFRRAWNVAMDNRQTIPGYKHYVDRATGARGAWFVTFLNVLPDPGATVNGVMFEVDDALIERLDDRERNYERVEVSANVSPAADGRVWVYVGSRAARHRFLVGRRSGRAVVSRDYYERVLGDFADVGADALRRFHELTDAIPCPILDLRRIDHPPAPSPLSARPAPASARRS